ncbi:MAG TPA: PSD1 and planctomycete cytochrome C domain-containing protein [Opitutaceae bacterium]|nr:PSD1 and planctomycete cytochrome C domain-containing protein [Opitutaceae bacterium]
MNRTCKAAGLALALAAGAPQLSAAVAAAPPIAPAAQPISPGDLQFFEARIRPIFADRCYKCHSRMADKIKGGLMLDTREGMLHGGDTGPAIAPGKPGDSLIVEAIGYRDSDLQMPPKGDRLSDQQVADITEWIRRGAPDPRSLVAKGSSSAYGGVGRDHWSFLPVRRQAVPVVADPAWCRTPVDNFILARLEESGMKPNGPADKYTLIRRATFDLTGLPPTEAEVQRFLVDDSPDAWARVVDRLLASPHYGERWGRYWLDVARYADTKGDTPQREDPRYPFAWTYRDYVIDAFNSDKPYNQFIVEQLAADRIVANEERGNKSKPGSVDQRPLAALGFLTLGNRFENSTNDIINDRIDVTTKAFLGLTVSCARCHDHKFDPIPTADYYSLYGVFADTAEPKQEPWLHPMPKTPALVDYLSKMQAAVQQKAVVEQELAQLPRTRLPQAERVQRRKDLQKQLFLANQAIVDLECSDAAPPKADVLLDVADPKDYPVLLRGEAQNKGPVVTRHFLSILSPDPKHPIAFRDGSGRIDLARAIASPSNPMTARVLVNRVWQQHFGTGFVSSPDDLGNQSAPPNDPELLDYLSSRFIDEGWSVKKLQRLIMLSSVYQEASAANPQYAEADPDNKLQWRYNVRQLDFEEMHDSILAIAGTIDFTMGGRSVPIGSEGFATRRAVYAFIDRRNPAEILTQFNFPNPSVPTGKRFLTQVPQQQLFLMNSPLVIETARKLVHSPEFMAQTTDELRVATLYIALFQRPPTPRETALCLRYVESNPGGTSTEVPETAQSERASQFAERQAKMAQAAQQNLRRKNPFQAEPGAAAFRSRAPLDAWTKLAHGLFQTNEAMFLN